MTLWDHIKAQSIAIKKLCDKFSLNYQILNPIYRQVNEEFWQIFLNGEISVEKMREERFAETLKRAGENVNDYKNISKEYLNFYSTTVCLIDGAIELLEKLFPFFELGILTNGFNDTQNSKISNSQIGKYMTYIISVTETNTFKPDPKFFDYAIEQTNNKPYELLCVGDNYEVDVVGAKKCGWKSVWFNQSRQPMPQIKPEPDGIIEELSQLPDLLDF